jgi:group I intron endonuclease
MERLSGIYRIVNKTNGKYYVGSSNNISKRFRDHKRELTFNRHHCIGLQRAWNKYGYDKFDFVIVENILSNNDLLTTEQKHLDNAMTNKENCYNSSMVAGGGDGFTGKKHSITTKQRMSESHKGMIFSNEHIMNISLAGKGKHGQKRREETKRKISLSLIGNTRNVGRKHTEEWKQNMREKMLGNNHAKKKRMEVLIPSVPAQYDFYRPTGTNSNVSPLTLT